MKFSGFAARFILICLCISSHRVHSQNSGQSGEYLEMLTSLINLTPDPEKTAQVSHLMLQRDAATFDLGPGTIVFCRPVLGRNCAVVYSGKGRFRMTPPTAVEKDQLGRFLENETADLEFTELMILFADSTAEELLAHLQFGPGNVPNEVSGFLKYCAEYLADEGDLYYSPDCLRPFLNRETNGFFYAHFSAERIKPFFFEINPYEEEEVRFKRRYPVDYVRTDEIICQFHLADEYDRSQLPWHEGKGSLRIRSYTIDARIADNLGFSAHASLNCDLTEPTPQWKYLSLFEKLEVDSLVVNGSCCRFVRVHESDLLWFRIDSLPPGKPVVLDLYYSGDLIYKIDQKNWLGLRSSVYWYPRDDSRSKAEFDLTFSIPSDYELVSVGQLKSVRDEADRKVSRWVSDQPMRNASFSIGVFEKWNVDDPDLPPLVICMNESHTSIRSIEDEVRQDITESLRMFTTLFGPLPARQLHVTEIPGLHGEAFPGLLHLSWTTYEATSLPARYRAESQILFRAHEVAHQWWGVGVDFRSYHDQWLSEAMAQYSGLWYTQLALRDNETFFEILKRWREQILSNREFVFESGQEAGPIWLGYRTHGSESQGDYALIIYRKGAWVLHMLRGMLIDLKTMKEDRFESILRDFYSSFVGKQAGTEDFRSIVEKHADEDMGWFFNQWIYDAKIPRYRYAYKTEKTGEGRYDLHLKVSQSDVSDNFRMPVILSVVLDDGRTARMRVTVAGPSSEFTIPGLPGEPEEIRFNEFESVLWCARHDA